MRFTRVLNTRATTALHARARYDYMNKRGEKISPALTNRPDHLSDNAHRLIDPAHDRWFYTKETFESTFEWDTKSIISFAVGTLSIFWLYFWMKGQVDMVNVFERGITLKQIESEHNSVLLFEPMQAQMAAFMFEHPSDHEFMPVYAGRYRNDHRG